MNKKILGIFGVLLVAAMLALPMATVFATKPSPITGAVLMLPGTPPSPYLDRRALGKSGNEIWTWTDLPLEISGDIVGVGVYNGHWVMQKPLTPDMKVCSTHGDWTLDVEVNGVSGELIIRIDQEKMRIISGTGGLQGLHGTGMLEMGATPSDFDYTINAHFDP